MKVHTVALFGVAALLSFLAGPRAVAAECATDEIAVMYNVSGGFADLSMRLVVLESGVAYAYRSVGTSWEDGEAMLEAEEVAGLREAVVEAIQNPQRALTGNAHTDQMVWRVATVIDGKFERLVTRYPDASLRALFSWLDEVCFSVLAGERDPLARVVHVKLKRFPGRRTTGATVYYDGEVAFWETDEVGRRVVTLTRRLEDEDLDVLAAQVVGAFHDGRHFPTRWRRDPPVRGPTLGDRPDVDWLPGRGSVLRGGSDPGLPSTDDLVGHGDEYRFPTRDTVIGQGDDTHRFPGRATVIDEYGHFNSAGARRIPPYRAVAGDEDWYRFPTRGTVIGQGDDTHRFPGRATVIDEYGHFNSAPARDLVSDEDWYRFPTRGTVIGQGDDTHRFPGRATVIDEYGHFNSAPVRDLVSDEDWRRFPTRGTVIGHEPGDDPRRFPSRGTLAGGEPRHLVGGPAPALEVWVSDGEHVGTMFFVWCGGGLEVPPELAAALVGVHVLLGGN